MVSLSSALLSTRPQRESSFTFIQPLREAQEAKQLHHLANSGPCHPLVVSRASHPHLKTHSKQRMAQGKLSSETQFPKWPRECHPRLHPNKHILTSMKRLKACWFPGKAVSMYGVVAVRAVSMNLPSPSSPVTKSSSFPSHTRCPTLQLSSPPALPQGEDHLSSSSSCTGSFLHCVPFSPHFPQFKNVSAYASYLSYRELPQREQTSNRCPLLLDLANAGPWSPNMIRHLNTRLSLHVSAVQCSPHGAASAGSNTWCGLMQFTTHGAETPQHTTMRAGNFD